MTPLVLHIGYPKTATTTLQMHLFSKHPQINYLGKYIPGYHFCDPLIGEQLNRLITADSAGYRRDTSLAQCLDDRCRQTDRRVTLLSTESIVHPAACDRGLVAERLRETFGPCRILITIRRQADILRSFHAMHGRFGQYLFLAPDDGCCAAFPLSPEAWLNLCERHWDRNFPACVDYLPVLARYAELFGRDNVCVLLFEQLASDPVGYIRRLSAFLDVDGTTAVQCIAGHREMDSRLGWEGQNTLQPTSSKAVKDADTTCRSVENWSEQTLQRLAQRYGPNNQRLAELFNLPLVSFGYTLKSPMHSHEPDVSELCA